MGDAESSPPPILRRTGSLYSPGYPCIDRFEPAFSYRKLAQSRTQMPKGSRGCLEQVLESVFSPSRMSQRSKGPWDGTVDATPTHVSPFNSPNKRLSSRDDTTGGAQGRTWGQAMPCHVFLCPVHSHMFPHSPISFHTLTVLQHTPTCFYILSHAFTHFRVSTCTHILLHDPTCLTYSCMPPHIHTCFNMLTHAYILSHDSAYFHLLQNTPRFPHVPTHSYILLHASTYFNMLPHGPT